MNRLYTNHLALTQLNMLCKLELIILFSIWANTAQAKPIERNSSVQQPTESVSKRLNSELQDIIKLAMLQADMHILKSLPEEKLALIENLLRLWQEEEEVVEEQPQADEPMEDASYLSDAPDAGDLTRVEFEENATLSSSYYYDANSSKAYRDMWVQIPIISSLVKNI